MVGATSSQSWREGSAGYPVNGFAVPQGRTAALGDGPAPRTDRGRRRPLGAADYRSPLMSNVSLAQLMRQYELDLRSHPVEAPAVPQVAPRLLILACSASKAKGEGLSAGDRYTGPLWQTLKTADPEGRMAHVAYLSARFGLGDARGQLPEYNSLLTRTAADAMIERGLGAFYPHYDMDFRTEAGRQRHLATRQPLRTPAGEIARIRRDAGRPFAAVAICGGKEYVRVAQAHVADLRDIGWISSEAPLTIINDQIGYMRAKLRAWLCS